MITLDELNKAITTCLQCSDPDAYTCIKLAAYYVIRDKLYCSDMPQLPERTAESTTADYVSGTEFSAAIRGRSINDVLAVTDDLMSMLKVVSPEIHEKALEKFKG